MHPLAFPSIRGTNLNVSIYSRVHEVATVPIMDYVAIRVFLAITICSITVNRRAACKQIDLGKLVCDLHGVDNSINQPDRTQADISYYIVEYEFPISLIVV